MKLIIDIPDEEYKTLSNMSEKEKVNELSYYERTIANGTPYEERPQTIACFNCKYNGKCFRDDPCCFCNEQFSEWEAENETGN